MFARCVEKEVGIYTVLLAFGTAVVSHPSWYSTPAQSWMLVKAVCGEMGRGTLSRSYGEERLGFMVSR